MVKIFEKEQCRRSRGAWGLAPPPSKKKIPQLLFFQRLEFSKSCPPGDNEPQPTPKKTKMLPTALRNATLKKFKVLDKTLNIQEV